ncbi:bifunctional adenosylcobinamide kinase/adenosylcobinamide-phosphate guanylyltransferase [Chloroflexota bacterium]
MKSILITGGVRSGKSHFAQDLARKSGGPVLFVATATAGDEEMRHRIEAHREARPSSWNTLETTTNIGGQILKQTFKARIIILDCVTLLINNIFVQHSGRNGDRIDALLIEKEVVAEIDELVRCIDRVEADFIIVSGEVGLGLVPADRTSRLYRDLLGKANQALAQHADEVYLMVAGIPLPVKPARTI